MTSPLDRRLDQDYLERQIRHISDEHLLREISHSWRAPGETRCIDWQRWADHWQTVMQRGRFTDLSDLIGTRSETVAALEPARDDILRAADRVLRHDIQGWGDLSIQHGPVVNFNADYGKSGKYGLHYWEWAKPLVRAHLLTGDEHYLVEFDALFNMWYEQRDHVHGDFPNLDVIWYEMGLGLRNRVFLEAYYLPHVGRTIQNHQRMLTTLLGAARWLFEEEQIKYRAGNWQIHGAYGLLLIGLMVPEFAEADQWVKLGAERLVEHAERDFFPDGCHSERCPSSYMLVVYRDLRNAARLLSEHRQYEELSQRLHDSVRLMLDWYDAIVPPDGLLPAINDGSRARFPQALRDDRRRLFHQEVSRIEQSVHFPVSGFTIMRGGASLEAPYLLINHGPWGGVHTHDDALSFELHAFGSPVAIDAGIGRTYDDPHHESWYVTSAAHNMLTVDDAALDRKSAEGREVAWTSLPSFDYFAATHHGYEASAGIVHRRHILFVKPHYFVLFDVVRGARAGTRLMWNLHTVPPASANGAGLHVLAATDEWEEMHGRGLASVAGIESFSSSNAEIDWLTLERRARGGEESLAVLLHLYRHRPPKLEFRRIGSHHFSVAHADGVDHLVFGSCSSSTHDLEFRGQSAVIRLHAGQVVSWGVSRAQTLRFGGATLHETQEPRDAPVLEDA